MIDLRDSIVIGSDEDFAEHPERADSDLRQRSVNDADSKRSGEIPPRAYDQAYSITLDGDLPGHNFRGNQWSVVGASSVVKGEGKEKTITRVDAKGKPLPKDIQMRMNALGIPPAWTNVHLSKDPNADLQAKGTAANGKVQSVYSAQHNENAAAEKFARLNEFDQARPGLVNAAAKDMAKGNDTAAAVMLINATGFRVGNSAQLGKEEAFGATTLEGRHVKVTGDKVYFHFIGKHGVDIEHEIKDAKLAKFIADKKAEVGKNGKLFDTNDGKVRDYIKAKTGNDSFKAHDFRTWHGTSLAAKLLKGRPEAKTEKEFKAVQKEVSTAVSEHLHNSPGMALSSYIAPSVWGSVRRMA
jgi:DNA topoisomerase-1